MDLFATPGLIQTLRSAGDNTVIPVRVVRETTRANAVGLRPLAETPPPNATAQSNVSVRFSSRALRLARSQADTLEHDKFPQREPPPRGRRLDVVA